MIPSLVILLISSLILLPQRNSQATQIYTPSVRDMDHLFHLLLLGERLDIERVSGLVTKSVSFSSSTMCIRTKDVFLELIVTTIGQLPLSLC